MGLPGNEKEYCNVNPKIKIWGVHQQSTNMSSLSEAIK